MKRRILFTLLSIVAVGALVWLILPAGESEPVYQGKPLREWLALYRFHIDGLFGNDQADEAIRQIGTNAIPTLLEMLQEHDSDLKLKWVALLRKQNFIQPPQTASLHNSQAAMAFHVLGSSDSNAVPALVQIYSRKTSIASQEATVEALGDIGPSASPAATPVLLDALTNSDNSLYWYAVLAIDQIHGQPEVFVPVLINELKDSDGNVRLNAARALAAYGPAAKSAVPALVALLNDSNQYVRTHAAYALKEIDPEAAAKAGVK